MCSCHDMQLLLNHAQTIQAFEAMNQPINQSCYLRIHPPLPLFIHPSFSLSLSLAVSLSLSLAVSLSLSLYININIYVCIQIHAHTYMYICTYIHTDKRREKERERESELYLYGSILTYQGRLRRNPAADKVQQCVQVVLRPEISPARCWRHAEGGRHCFVHVGWS